MNLYTLVNFISTNFDKYLYIYLFALVFIEEAGIPLPISGDIYTFLAGYQVITGKANPVFIIFEILIATLLGASLLFLIVSIKGEPLVEKYGKFIRLTQPRLQNGKSWFARYGERVIIFGRWIPGLRIVLTVVGGIFKLNYGKFLIAITLSTIVWSSTFLILGMIFGHQQKKILEVFKYINPFTNYIIFVVIALLMTVIVYKVITASQKRNAS